MFFFCLARLAIFFFSALLELILTSGPGAPVKKRRQSSWFARTLKPLIFNPTILKIAPLPKATQGR